MGKREKTSLFWCAFCGICALLILIGMLSDMTNTNPYRPSYFEDMGVFFWLFVACTAFFLGMFLWERNDRVKKGHDDAYYRKLEYDVIKWEKEQAIKSQTEGAPWERYYTFPCPFCGHYKVRNAHWEDKQMSVAFWGAASTKIGDHYKCTHCGKTWA